MSTPKVESRKAGCGHVAAGDAVATDQACCISCVGGVSRTQATNRNRNTQDWDMVGDADGGREGGRCWQTEGLPFQILLQHLQTAQVRHFAQDPEISMFVVSLVQLKASNFG